VGSPLPENLAVESVSFVERSDKTFRDSSEHLSGSDLSIVIPLFVKAAFAVKQSKLHHLPLEVKDLHQAMNQVGGF
jgi:hypothetical protein